MTKKAALWLILGFMLTAVVCAEVSYTDLTFTLKDINTNKVISSFPVTVILTETNVGTEIVSTIYLSPKGTFDYTISPGHWNLHLQLDNLSTPEVDYFLESAFLIENGVHSANKTLYLIPVGSIEGSVVDSSGNLIDGAELQFKCRFELKSAYPSESDNFGSFIGETVPAGSCKVSAAYSNLVGVETVLVEQGNSSTVVIKLDKSIISASKGFFIYFLIILIAVIVFAFFMFKHRKKSLRKKESQESKLPENKPKKEKSEGHAVQEKTKESTEAVKEAGNELSRRTKDILDTLNDREKEVVNFILSNQNKTSQAKIYNTLGIPKTSLSRILQSLEAKKVIKLEKLGKMKKVKLTPWFLDMEQK